MSNDLGWIIHRGDRRGHVKIDWLDSYHTFSFGSFQDPQRMGFRLPPVGYANDSGD